MLPLNEGNKVCEAFGMHLASPQNQDEFDKLKQLVLTLGEGSTAISGFRSEIDENVWVDSSNQINYTMDWIPGTPSIYGDSHCIGRSDVKIIFKNNKSS